MESDFRNITIIGAGLIGGSLCKAIKRFVPDTSVYIVDRREHLEQIKSLLPGDEYFNEAELSAPCSRSDLIILAVPVNEIIRLLPTVAVAAKPGTIVTDAGSVKVRVMTEAEKLFGQNSATFIGGHPMAGSEKSGALYASPFLLENAIYTLSPLSVNDNAHVNRLASFLHRLGARVLTIDAEAHDRIAASISHVPRILTVAMMNHIAQRNNEEGLYLKMAAGGFRDMTRIASGPYDIWDDIIAGNREKILEEMDSLIDAIKKLTKKVRNHDLKKAFEDAAKTRLSIPSDTRGFLKALYDVYIEVEDKPGVIASISGALDRQHINIKDIEILKVRENEGGSMRLAFATRSEQKKALDLLKKEGFQCSMPR